jgi:hypothetical protein
MGEGGVGRMAVRRAESRWRVKAAAGGAAVGFWRGLTDRATPGEGLLSSTSHTTIVLDD